MRREKPVASGREMEATTPRALLAGQFVVSAHSETSRLLFEYACAIAVPITAPQTPMVLLSTISAAYCFTTALAASEHVRERLWAEDTALAHESAFGAIRPLDRAAQPCAASTPRLGA